MEGVGFISWILSRSSLLLLISLKLPTIPLTLTQILKSSIMTIIAKCIIITRTGGSAGPGLGTCTLRKRVLNGTIPYQQGGTFRHPSFVLLNCIFTWKCKQGLRLWSRFQRVLRESWVKIETKIHQILSESKPLLH